MISIEDLKIGDEAYVISQRKIGTITGVKRKKKNPKSYLITIEYDNGVEIVTTLDNLDEPNYRITPLGIMWCSLNEAFGDEFLLDDDSVRLAEKVLDSFIKGMQEAGFMRKKEEED